ncbi:MAG: M48 family metallopeptidase [Acidobacteriota bacterium]
MSLAGRAFLAVALMIGFYGLALGLAFGLLYVPYAEAVYLHRLHARLTVICAGGALAILLSILPRPDRFPLPGPQLLRDAHPRLFAELDRIASAVGQRMPAEVYLVPDVNAWLAQRGGIMGLGSRRVMGLGLPMLQALTVSQMRAVLAHEFGHFAGGDTMLGPWVHKTYSAIGRTLATLRQTGSALQAPFRWYGRMFLRVTHAVSRHQERQADALAARTMGAQALAGGLVNVHGAAFAYEAYLNQEYFPILGGGLRPPLAAGFLGFMQNPTIHELLSKAVTREVEEGEGNPYDSHPPLAERLDAIEKMSREAPPAEDPPALTLLDGVDALEEALVLMFSNADKALALKPVSWAEVPERFYVPYWENLARRNIGDLDGVTAADLPDLARKLVRRAQNVAQGSHRATDPTMSELVAAGAALTLALRKQGFALTMGPGEPCRRTGWTVLTRSMASLRSASRRRNRRRGRASRPHTYSRAATTHPRPRR